MTADLAIETTDLRKVFRRRWPAREFTAVDGVSLRVRRGTTFGFLGPNGAGKTTLVKMLLSAVHPTSGVARLFGRDAREKGARRRAGYLPENHRFPTYLTGRGMLDFYGALSGMDARQRTRRSAELLELVGLWDWGDVRLRKYSKGMLQRLGLAQALMHQPELLILDEPTDGVDPLGRRMIRGIMTELEQRGVTIFLNSHLLGEVELFCREVAIVKAGRIVLDGEVRKLTARSGYRVRAQDGRELTCATLEEANARIDEMRRAGVLVASVVPAANTLEQVFMEAVEGRQSL